MPKNEQAEKWSKEQYIEALAHVNRLIQSISNTPEILEENPDASDDFYAMYMSVIRNGKLSAEDVAKSLEVHTVSYEESALWILKTF